MLWKTCSRTFDLRNRALVMGVLNATPDSFSDGGAHLDPQAAADCAAQMEAAGADVVDVGGESTRPGSLPVSAREEIARVLPVIHAIRARTTIPISIDTTKAEVALAALDAGAEIINDLSALADDSMVRLAAESGAGVILAHMPAPPATMQHDPRYDDVVEEVARFLAQRVAFCEAAGIARESIALDPGIGFGKTVRHNLLLLRDLGRIVSLGKPVLVGVSRKSFIGKVLGIESPQDRVFGTVAITALAREKGARIFRVHDVRCNREALRMTEAILDPPTE